jgi:hypothetical protein
MSIKSSLGWPSFGFFLLVASHSLVAGLTWWGWQSPSLDDAFEILARRDLGQTAPFSASDIATLRRVWAARPGFGRALLGRSSVRFLEPTEIGWLSRRQAHLVVAAEADRTTEFLLEGRGEPSDYPIVVRIHGMQTERRIEILPNRLEKVECGLNDCRQPSILNVEMTAGRTKAAGAPTWAVRVVPSNPNAARYVR